jgi:hypothetical protein
MELDFNDTTTLVGWCIGWSLVGVAVTYVSYKALAAMTGKAVVKELAKAGIKAMVI